ncbi:mediator complex subunit MED14-domain-containing protein [Lophiotrema nucula]|uniref:Mediator of RNA polymerase II transcription subunit 14 n=1 Tax=Lophiotrema nucula TaxID=690887 RepID=A0A6A5ZRH3_9PLEO|nr:mediator complex subunit MED14-domain-containing protein [Lophiotrema nucula]
MPGLIIMNQNGADGTREPGNLKRTHDGNMVNGDRGVKRKDTPTGGSSANGAVVAPAVNGAMASTQASSAGSSSEMANLSNPISELPPELAHLPSEFYHPYSKLVQRISQECFNALNEVLSSMAEIPVNQHANGLLTNGAGNYAGANGVQDASPANQQKKLMLMKFAQEQRAKFIKLLVLAEWGKKSSREISRLIDISTWAREQSVHMDAVDLQMMQLKEALNRARQPNPDIRTALEILSTGKASWLPDFGLIPAIPLTAQKALDLLRYLNTSLTIRLNVHEDLPRHLRNWRVASGKATFTIDSEFEVDVTSFSENAEDQWHFIDLRLLFSPSPEINVDSAFYVTLKQELDGLLQQSGLAACFDHLHNFVLTHKIAVLNSQASELKRAGWAGSLEIKLLHRALVVQYWTDRPGRPSWIEFGLSSERPPNGKISWRGPPIPTIAARWVRQGEHIDNVDLGLDWKNLSMERMLKRVIALHTGHLLRATRDGLTPRLPVKANLSETEPCDCSLEASLGGPGNVVTVSLESVTGRYAVRPATALSARAEQEINQAHDPVRVSNRSLTDLLSRSLIQSINRHTQQIGWQQVTKFRLTLETVKQAVKLDVLGFSIYKPRGWTKWTLATIVDSSGSTWWILELSGNGTVIETAEQIRLDVLGQAHFINRRTLGRIERIGVNLVSLRVTMRELQKRNMPFAFRADVAYHEGAQLPSPVQRPSVGWILRLSTNRLLGQKAEKDRWLDITCHGFKTNGTEVWHIASGTMDKDVAISMKKIMASSPQKTFTFHEDGTFSILISTKFGEQIIDAVIARLKDINRLRTFTSTLHRRRMKLKSSSLSKVEFQYSSHLTATVDFSDERNIKVSFDPTNPHNRIKKYLEEIINERSPLPHVNPEDESGLDRFCTTLIMTRPILTCLAEIEAKPHYINGLPDPDIHPHSWCKYRIQYQNPLCSFDVRLRPKDNHIYWHVEDNNRRGVNDRPSPERNPNRARLDSLSIALRALYRDQGKGWYGVRTSILANVDAIPAALKKLHETVISCSVDTKSGAEPFKTVTNNVQNPQQPQPQPQPSQNQQQQQHHHHQQQHQQQPRQQAPARMNTGRPQPPNGNRQAPIELD